MAKKRKKKTASSSSEKESETKVRGKTVTGGPSQHARSGESERIVIDEEENLIFSSEQELYEHFRPAIQKLEAEFFKKRSESDIPVDQFPEFEECLSLLLEEPFEIWQDSDILPGQTVYNYIGEFEDEEKPEAEPVFYVAQVYLAQNIPSFVYLHFPTRDESLVEKFRTGSVIFDISRVGLLPGAAEGDALSEGEELAVGLYQAMLKVRSDKDIPEERFQEFIDFREETIEDADEIWRSTDLQGNVLVSFIKECPEVEIEGFSGEELYYIVVTVEEESSQTHALLFSFPTVDGQLVDRYRHGENLQADEVSQQSNH